MSSRYAVACGIGTAVGATWLTCISFWEGQGAMWKATGIPVAQGGKTQPLMDRGISIAGLNYFLDHLWQFLCAGTILVVGILAIFDCVAKPICKKLGFDLPFHLYFFGVLIITLPIWAPF